MRTSPPPTPRRARIGATLVSLAALSLLVATPTRDASAQAETGVHADYRYYAPADVETGSEFVELTTPELQMHRLAADALFSIGIGGGDSGPLVGARYYGLLPSFEAGDFEAESDNLHAMFARVGWQQEFASALRLTLLAEPGSATQSGTSFGDGFLFDAEGELTVGIGDTFRVGGGILYSSDFGDQIILPQVIVELDVKVFRLRAHLPRHLEAGIAVPAVFAAGLFADIEGQRFRVEDDLAERLGADAAYVRTSTLSTGAFVELLAIPAVLVRAEAGLNPLRRFETDTNNDSHDNVSFEPASSWFAGGSVSLLR